MKKKTNKKTKTIGILPCWCLGSNGRIPWWTFGQDHVLDASLGSRLLGSQGLQEIARTTYCPQGCATQLAQILAIAYLALVQIVAKGQAFAQCIPCWRWNCCKYLHHFVCCSVMVAVCCELGSWLLLQMTLQCWNMLLNTSRLNNLSCFLRFLRFFSFCFYILLKRNLIIEISLRTVMFLNESSTCVQYTRTRPSKNIWNIFKWFNQQLLRQITCAANYQMLISITLLALTPIFRNRKQYYEILFDK